VPDWQLSVCVHRLPSLQGVPFGATALVHVPVAVLQVAGWHASLAVHTTGLAPAQTPD
jgi:hypothetical protein